MARRKDAPKASDVISMLEKMGGVAVTPAVVTKASPLPGPGAADMHDFMAALEGKVALGMTVPEPFISSGVMAGPYMGGGLKFPIPGPPLLHTDSRALLRSKGLSDEIAIHIADVLDTVDENVIFFDALLAMELEIPAQFSSIIEVVSHPSFIEASQAHFGCVWVVVYDAIHRVHFSVDKADVIDVPRDISADGVDPNYYLKPSWYADLKSLIERGEPVLIIGPAGVGKTEAVERIFKERDQKLEIVSCTPRTTANNLEGATDLVVEDGHQITKFTPAAPAIASEYGYGLLLDEADAAPSEAMYSMYRLLDAKPMHIVRKGYDSEVPLNPQFRVIGTQNTEGRGDDRGLYHGRAYQDEAFLDRWRNTVRVDYPPSDQEILILRKRTGISGPEGEDIVKSAKALRSALQQDEIMFTCTLRRTLAVASNLAFGMNPRKSWDYAVVNRATPEDGAKIMTILQRIYGSKLTKKRTKRTKAK